MTSRLPGRAPAVRTTRLPTLPDASVTDEIRATLDDLRKVLDDVSAPPLPPRRRRRRGPLLLATAATVLVAGAVVSAATGSWPFSGSSATAQPSPGGRPSPSSSAGAGAPGQASPSSTTSASPAASTSPSTSPPDAPAGTVSAPLTNFPGASAPAPQGLPSSGPGVDATGSLVAVGLTGRDEQVYERAVTATAGPLVLRLPDLAAVPGLGGRLQLAVSDLAVAVDGAPARVDAGVPGAWTVLDVPAGATVELRYRLTGAVVDTDQTLAGRAFVAMTSLSARGLGSGADSYGATQAVLPGGPAQATVRAMSCPDAPLAEQLCGTLLPDGRWVATVAQGSLTPLVLVTADLAG